MAAMLHNFVHLCALHNLDLCNTYYFSASFLSINRLLTAIFCLTTISPSLVTRRLVQCWAALHCSADWSSEPVLSLDGQTIKTSVGRSQWHESIR
jgi:hypothetical protein